MDCRTFRRQHLEYLDGTLPCDAMAAMHAHGAKCACCSRFDVTLRRGLMVARSLTPVTPSASFSFRLRAALQGTPPRHTASELFSRALAPLRHTALH